MQNVVTKHFWRVLSALTKLRKATISFIMSACLSVCPHGTTRLWRNEFYWNFI